MVSRLRIIVTGLIAQHPLLGGMTWHHLQYVLGLSRLGHDVYYFEDSGEWPYNLDGGPSGNDWVAYDCTNNVRHLSSVMSYAALEAKWAYHFPITSRWFGLSDERRRAIVKSADLLINVSGGLLHPQDYRQVQRLVYVDTDPIFTQIKLNQPRDQADFRQRVDTHDVHFSFSERVPGGVPDTGHHWRATRQPIVLSEWATPTPARDVFTTVTNWTSYKPLEYRGRGFAQKDVEFRRFLDLPRLVRPAQLEVALSRTQHLEWELADDDTPPAATSVAPRGASRTPRELLSGAGWRVVDAAEVCHGMDAYRAYLQSSKAEWTVAKNGYVVGQPGWFSDRSACYLAAGRPVVVQDTGFGAVLPVGEGILPFGTMEEAVAAIHEVGAHYARHAKAARALAAEYFDSDKVLVRLVEEALSGRG